jgi:hypothetical protein
MLLMERKLIRIIIILLTICIVLAIGYFLTGKNPMEPFVTSSNTLPLPADGNVPNGYYKIDSSNIAMLPAGNEASPLPYGGSSKIPSGYYMVSIAGTNMMAQIPHGFTVSPDMTTLVPVTQSAAYEETSLKNINGNTWQDSNNNTINSPTQAPSVPYNSNNYNIQYHDDLTSINNQGIYDTSINTMYVKDNTGNIVAIDSIGNVATPTYYQPGSFVFGATNFVPNYEDSVYLSRTTGESQVGNAYPTSSKYGGFCNSLKHDITGLESKCNSLDPSVCSSTGCCVLVGGVKCTTGNKRGPRMKSVYSDPGITNKDVYYYMGKCYGNCQ